MRWSMYTVKLPKWSKTRNVHRLCLLRCRYVLHDILSRFQIVMSTKFNTHLLSLGCIRGIGTIIATLSHFVNMQRSFSVITNATHTGIYIYIDIPYYSSFKINWNLEILNRNRFSLCNAQSLLLAHDSIAQKDFYPHLPDIPIEVDEDEETVKIVQLVKSNEPLVCVLVHVLFYLKKRKNHLNRVQVHTIP